MIVHSDEKAEISVVLHDDVTGQDINVKLVVQSTGIELIAEGHGDKTSEEGHGTPVWIEFRDGELKLHAWADINQEDPTHDISLAGARESCRDARPMFVVSTKAAGMPGEADVIHTFEPFAGKVDDRVVVRDPNTQKADEGRIVALIPGQVGFNPPMAEVEFEFAGGFTAKVNLVDIEAILD